MTIVYAVGLTHHTTGGQLIRSAALLQLLLGNMGRPGGGMNAERGHANIQGNTDHAISWEILPGYLRIPAPGQKNLERLRPAERAQEVRRQLVELLRHELPELHGRASSRAGTATRPRRTNEYAFDFVPKPASNSSWISIYDQALKGKMEGVILSGMTATSIGPDSNQVHGGARQAEVARRHGPAAHDELGVLAAAGRGPEDDPDRGVHGADHPLDREGRLVRQQRPLDAVEGRGDPARRRRPATTTGSWPTSSSA